jgi:hypothetical protein
MLFNRKKVKKKKIDFLDLQSKFLKVLLVLGSEIWPTPGHCTIKESINCVLANASIINRLMLTSLKRIILYWSLIFMELYVPLKLLLL